MTGRERARVGLLFQIYRTHELSSRLTARALEPCGIRGDEYAVYSYLMHGPLTLTDLANGTGMPLTTAAGYVKKFEARGDIVKTRNPDDGRSFLLELTPACRDWILDVAKIFTKTIDHLDGVLQVNGIDSADLIDQLTLLQQLITDTLEELGDA
jgi:DNA-binding MarR family transcriptional regulator